MKIEAIRISGDAVKIVFASRQLVLPLSAEYLGFRKGEDIGEELLESLDKISLEQQSFLRALFYLRNPKSIYEVRRYLATKKFGVEAVNAAIERLIEKGYLDDMHFALSFISSKARGKPVGVRFLRAALKKKGVEDVIVKQALTESGFCEDAQAALEAARKKIRKEYDRNKIARFLFSRGFSTEIVYGTLRVLDKENRNTRHEE